MKQLLLFLTLLGSSLFSYSQDNKKDIPDAVTEAFSKKFADANNVVWSKKGEQYVASFNKERTDYKAVFDAQGKCNMYKMGINKSEIPAVVLNKINQTKECRIEDAEKVIKEDEVFYQMELDSRNYYAKVVYTADGKLSSNSYWD